MTRRPEIGALPSLKLPPLEQAVLKGGLRTIAVRRPTVPLVEVRIAFPLSPEQIARRADALVLSESLFAGTKRHSRDELAKAVERLGGSLAAYVDRDRLTITGSALAERLGELLSLVCEVLSEATYPEKEVAADRGRTADEITLLLSRPEVLADEALDRRLFAGHPYGAGIPRPASIRRANRDALRRLQRSLLSPPRGHLVIVGAVQPERALAAAEERLADWLAAGSPKDIRLPALPAIRPGPARLVDRPGAVQSNLRLGGPAPRRSDPDWPATAIAVAILGGMFTSRLVANLRERNGYTYSPRLRVSHGRAGSTSVFSAEVATESTAASLVETRYEYGLMATGGVTDDELEAARRYLTGAFLYETATQSGLASSLTAWSLVGVGPEYLTEHPRRLARVSKAEVGAAARRYLAPSETATVVLGDASRVRDGLAAVDPLAGRG